MKSYRPIKCLPASNSNRGCAKSYLILHKNLHTSRIDVCMFPISMMWHGRHGPPKNFGVAPPMPYTFELSSYPESRRRWVRNTKA